MLAWSSNFQPAIQVKGRFSISRFQQFQKLGNDWPLNFLVNFFQAVVVAVDVPAFLGPLQQVQVVFPGQQAHIVDLRNPRGKNLQQPGQEVLLVIIAQG